MFKHLNLSNNSLHLLFPIHASKHACCAKNAQQADLRNRHSLTLITNLEYSCSHAQTSSSYAEDFHVQRLTIVRH